MYMWRELLLLGTGHFDPVIAYSSLATVFFGIYYLLHGNGLCTSHPLLNVIHLISGWKCTIRSLSFFCSGSEWSSWATPWSG